MGIGVSQITWRLRPEEQRIVGMWLTDGLWTGNRSEILELRADRTVVAWHDASRPALGYVGASSTRGQRYVYQLGVSPVESGVRGTWSRRGDVITLRSLEGWHDRVWYWKCHIDQFLMRWSGRTIWVTLGVPHYQFTISAESESEMRLGQHGSLGMGRKIWKHPAELSQ